MARKPVLIFLAKVVPLFLVFLYLWHELGVAHGYYRLVAAVLDAVYPGLDPAGAVTGVAARGDELGVGLLVGANRQVLSLNATDITSNAALLFSMFLASPIRRRERAFLVVFTASAVILFLVHVFTAMMLIQKAFFTHPEIMAGGFFSGTDVKLVLLYTTFYEELGMYLVVLLLWFPYIVWCIRGDTGPPARTAPAPAGPPPRR